MSEITAAVTPGFFNTHRKYKEWRKGHPNCTCTYDDYDGCLRLHADCPDHGIPENQDNPKNQGNDLGGKRVKANTFEMPGIYQIACGCRWTSRAAWQNNEAKIKSCSIDAAIKQAAKATDEQVGGDHYSKMPIQPIDYIVKNGIPYREANVIKYVSRHRSKNGAEDIRKAIHYLNMILEDYER